MKVEDWSNAAMIRRVIYQLQLSFSLLCQLLHLKDHFVLNILICSLCGLGIEVVVMYMAHTLNYNNITKACISSR